MGWNSLCFLLAQGDPITGSAGWVGTGLLGLVLSWIFFKHLPSKDEQLSQLLKAHQGHIENVVGMHEEELKRRDSAEKDKRAEFLTALEKLQTFFQASLEKIEQRAERGINALCVRLEKLEQHVAQGPVGIQARAEYEARSDGHIQALTQGLVDRIAHSAERAKP